MGLYTATTRDWLEQRFMKRNAAGVYFAHMPVYGLGHPDAEGGHVGRYARFLRILRELDSLSFTSLLDVGGAEGYLAHIVSTLFGARTATTDLSLQACLRARELFGLPTAAVDSARLPFADGAFDVVVCSEVIEHVEHPVETLLELQRIARVAVVLTTEEVRYDQGAIDDYLFRRPAWPHMERNLFHPDDLAACLPGVHMVPQCDVPPPQEALAAEPAIGWLLANTKTAAMAPGCIGVVAVIEGPAFVPRARQHDDVTLLQHLLGTTAIPGVRAAPPTAAADAAWSAQLRAPEVLTPLQRAADRLRGPRDYPLHDGVPDFVSVQAPPLSRDALVQRTATLPAAQRTALLGLRDRLFLPDRWSQDWFDLRQREHQRGFWSNHELVPRGPGFCWRATGNDPWVVTPCLQRALASIELELRIHAPDAAVDAATGQVFWKGAADEAFAEERSVKFALRNDGQVHRYLVPLAGHPCLPAEVQWLRLDLADGPCEIDFLSMRLR